MASTELRAAAQQALEALELGYDSAKAEADQYHAAMAGYRPQRHAEMDAEVQKIAAAITALRVALAEPDLFHCPKCGGPADNGHDRSIPPSPYWCTKCMAEPVQEPVAWSFEARHIDSAWAAAVTLKHPGPEGKYMRKVTPLYTSPPQRKPLTEEEIDSIWDSEKAFADIYAIARAIERAHGIDGAPEERNFCSRCGKRTNGIHTCTPPAPLTDEVIADLWHQNGGFHHHFARAIERWLKGNP